MLCRVRTVVRVAARRPACGLCLYGSSSAVTTCHVSADSTRTCGEKSRAAGEHTARSRLYGMPHVPNMCKHIPCCCRALSRPRQSSMAMRSNVACPCVLCVCCGCVTHVPPATARVTSSGHDSRETSGAWCGSSKSGHRVGACACAKPLGHPVSQRGRGEQAPTAIRARAEASLPKYTLYRTVP